MEFTFYADESGNAGANYLDTSQPFHVAGGLLVPAESEAKVRAELTHCRGSGTELKGSQMLRKPTGLKRATACLQSLKDCGAVPFYWVMEREYCIAGKLIDVFLDPAYYPEATWLRLLDFERRDELTQTVLESVSQSVLHAFAEAYRSPSVEGWRTILDAVIEELRLKRKRKLCATFRAARANVESIIDHEHTGQTHSEYSALNIPALAHTLRMVDRFVEYRRGRFRLVHDVNTQFDASFRSMLTMLCREVPNPELARGKRDSYRLFVTKLAEYSFADSCAEVGLQGADLVVSAVARLLRNIPYPPNKWPLETRDLANLLMPSLLQQTALFGGLYGQMDTKIRLFLATVDVDFTPTEPA